MQRACYYGRVRYLLLPLWAVAQIVSGATITGTITDSRGTALPSMVAAAYTPTGDLQGTAASDSRGAYILNLQPGRYRVLAYDLSGAFATEFGGNADSFDTSPMVNLSSTVGGINFSMEKAGTISGTVVSAGAPLSGITIAAYNVGSGTRRAFTQTAANGTYSLAIAPGQYKFAAYDQSGTYALAFFANTPTFDGALPLSVASTQQLTANFDLPRAAHLSGTVVDIDTNVILPGTTVFAYSADGTSIASTLSDSAGNFAFAVPPGSYKLVAADVSHIYAAGFADDANSFSNAHTLTPGAGQSISAIRIPLHRAGVVAGKVTESTGAVLAGISVAAYNNDGSQRTVATTDPSGSYKLTLPPGDFRIAAFDSFGVFVTQFYPQRVLFSNATSVAVTAAQTTPSIDFALGRGAHFNGNIVDLTTQTPIEGVSVGAYDDAGNQMNVGVTDSMGNYTLVIPSGRFKLAAFDARFRYVTRYGGGSPNYENAVAYPADAPANVRVDFSMARGVHVTGTVADSSGGLAVSGVDIAVLDPDGNRLATTTAHDGRFDFVLAPGSYRLLAVDPLGRYGATFYDGPVVVSANGLANPITMTLLQIGRRHPAHH